MASIVKKKTKKGVRYVIQLSPGENESRPKISLGKVTKKQADDVLRHIETLLKCQNTGSLIPASTQEWSNGINDKLRKRLRILGLIGCYIDKKYKVEEWIKKYIKERPDVKQATKRKWQNVKNKLSAFFKNDIINEVTVQQAKKFRIYLQNVIGLSENTTRRHIGIARQFFNAAVDAELITKNPFRGQSVSVRANPTRFYYVTQDVALKVLDACPDNQWRLIFGLARWGGLRCPSEILKLKWQDVDFEHQRFVVHASKTEHHANIGIRTVPMFPELKPLFQDAFDNAKDGDVYCITRYREKSVNLRTQLTKIIKRAGLDVWPKLFQNMRSTRETELFKLTGGNVKAVCSWIGNSPAVAVGHYAQVTEADIQEATKNTLLCNAEKRVQKRVQTITEMTRHESHESEHEHDLSLYGNDSKREISSICGNVQKGEKWAIQDSNL